MKQFLLFSSLIVVFIIVPPVFTKDSQCGARNESPTKPCPQNDKNCVRAYFQSRSKCKTDVASSDTLYKKELNFFFPYFNLTIDQYNLTMGGLCSGKIVDFLVDYQTNLLVLTVKFANVTFKASSDFIYYQTAMEPRRITTPSNELYPSFLITTIFYSATSPNVNNSFSVGNITDTPAFTLGSCATETTDPVLVNLFKDFTRNINVAVQESFRTRSRVLALDFIQKNLCNYGEKP